MQTPGLDVVVVNWNAGRQLQECVDSLAEARQEGWRFGRVRVVDNASSDGSGTLQAPPGLPLQIVRNESNRGFAAACNQGAGDSMADFLLFLNPDAAIYPATLSRCIAFLGEAGNERVGIIGVQLVNENGEVARSCARFPTTPIFVSKMVGLNRLLPSRFPDNLYSEWNHQETRAVDQVMGAFFFMRRSLFEDLGGFDERFFVYFEEVDLSYRAWKAGWSTWFVADAQAFHRGCGTTEQIKATRLFYSLRSRILYGFKHFSKGSAWVLVLATLGLEPVARIAQALARGSTSSVKEVTLAYARLWSELAQILRSRRTGAKSGTAESLHPAGAALGARSKGVPAGEAGRRS